MKSILIVYATKEGQTAKVAKTIAAHLQKAGVTVHLVNAEDEAAVKNVDLDRYDRLVFGASMHAGGLEKELIDFLNKNKDQIRLKRSSLFLVLLSAAAKDPKLKAEWLADAKLKVEEQLHVPFEDMEMIAGALMYSRYPLLLKWIMKLIAKRAGEDTDTSTDYEYTDWRQVERYAAGLIK